MFIYFCRCLKKILQWKISNKNYKATGPLYLCDASALECRVANRGFLCDVISPNISPEVCTTRYLLTLARFSNISWSPFEQLSVGKTLTKNKQNKKQNKKGGKKPLALSIDFIQGSDEISTKCVW